ncbi:MAG: hypothetical protein A3H95_14420 [Acidobacteria bacterium RIFCSPLOWO2_02_FULL_64_15]|nr:MAG: hypothetical protein A3H95_14420 [Acidobacteria bacterium RIFCSPLOWO2_02_FULL_64_15]
MALPSVRYEPRSPAGSVLYQVVREQFETFRVQAASLRDGDGLPRFVEQEFRSFLRCGWLRGRARWDGVQDGRGGAVAIVQRFGGALNLNVHIHALVVDGVFARDEAGALAFHPAPRLTDLDVAEVLATVEPGIRRVLDRRGLGDRDEASEEDAWAAEAPVPAGQRARLEAVCRYALRPPVARERLSVTVDGRVRLQLRHRWADGTTHLEWDPLDFLGRLAVLVPRPRINLILYHGVLAPRAAWRSAVVTHTTATGRDAGAIASRPTPHGPRDTPTAARGPGHNRLWADLMSRTFGFDVLACPRCGGRLRLVALIEQAAVIERILHHLDLPAEIPAPRPARAPPLTARDADLVGDETPMFDPCS